MTTAERHRAFSDVRELDRLYAGHRPYKAFTVIPHRIVFQQFGRCDTQEQQVIFRNDDCVSALCDAMRLCCYAMRVRVRRDIATSLF